MLFFPAALQAEFYEAAILDGAGLWTRFWHITLPLLSPTMSFVVTISLINSFVQVDHVIVLTRGDPSDSTNILLNYIFQVAHEQRDIGRSAAVTVVCVATLLFLLIGAARAIERGAAIET